MEIPSAFVNGRVATDIALGDRGFNYGHGLFETIRLSGSEAPLWPWHHRRLLAGAEKLGIELQESLLEAYFKQALAALPDDGVLKLTVTAGNDSSGYRRFGAGGEGSSYCFQFRQLPAPRQPLLLQLCDYRLPLNPVLAGVKHLNRLDQVMAARELRGDSEGLLLDSENRVVESLSGNLFCLLDGQWVTPDLSFSGVRGVMREYLLDEIFPVLGLSVKQARFGLQELVAAQAVFICNAVRGIEPVSTIVGHRAWSDLGVVSDIRFQLLEQLPCFDT